MNFFRKFSSQPHFSKIIKRSFNSFKFPGDSLDPPHIHGIHVFHCPDAVGIVAKLSECIASRGGNILGADVFVPEKKHVFYSRSEFAFDPSKWSREQMDEDFGKIAKTFNALKSVVRVPDIDQKYKIAVFASKQDHCLVDLLHAWQDGKLPVDITRVISNHDRHPDSHVMRFLERQRIPYHFVKPIAGDRREEEILDLVQDTDFLVLARYMQILSGDFLKRYGKDIINIHHGLLPSFKGGNPSRQAFNCGVKLIGATTHFVTEELDAGPIIEQMVERVSHRDNFRTFVQKSENLEKQCLSKAIRYYCELRVLPFVENKTVVF
ncbi:formyltetrahydrofolate deformylase 1, mitochondrial [Beta vulgaris subsp. vulgaris]|uniref:formyltetrahydrofolate deformylase 1, mitochondrial n=1 Tax=Beta vulgaris subsp. vulgaris TaxID=3555 RepID=UPI00203678F8|nr:formyltetrahydrofolate deformylase 1, mitochondrial [Beta vulgaris subsp. vulgaris]